MVKIRLIDSVCFGNWHWQFNELLIEILSNIADEVNYRGVQRIGENKLNIKRKKIFVTTSSSRWGITLRFFSSLLNDTWQLIIARKEEILVYSFDSTISVRLINALNKILQKRIIMFRHGSMEMLQTDPFGKGLFYRLESKLTRQFFLNDEVEICDHIHFFVLGDVILKNLSAMLSQKKMKHFHSIDLISNFDINTFTKKVKIKDNINIGTVGVLNEYKGGRSFLRLAKNLKDNGVSNVNLSVTGKIDFDISLLQNVGIDLPSNKGKSMVSMEELICRLEDLDYVLYFYSTETYKLTASAAVFEAINRKRPIIALRNEYFEYIFNKYGSVGYLVDTVDEMSDLVSRISKNTDEFVEFDFERIQERLSTENLTKRFTEQLCEIGFIEDKSLYENI